MVIPAMGARNSDSYRNHRNAYRPTLETGQIPPGQETEDPCTTNKVIKSPAAHRCQIC